MKRLRFKSINKSVQNANKGLLGSVKEIVKKQVVNVKTQIQSKVAEVKQQLRQMVQSQQQNFALAGGDVRYIEDTGTVGRNTPTPSPKPSNTQPSQNSSNKKPAEDKGTVKDVTFKKGYDTHLTEVEGFKAKPNIGIKGGHNLENFEQFILDNFGNQVKDINQAVTKTSHPDISGIYEVKYKLPVYDGLSKENGGKGNFTGQWKEYKNPKTVYDPKVFSDEQILKLGREAMEEGISNNRIIQGGDRSPSDMVEGYVNVNGKQLKFMGFKDKNTGEISNFFPVLD
ncbi:CdiA family toxin C-terminal domain-containing protein [Lysinibacillus sp. NPDC056220]|uniref:CdiA family toxin C-terminal domain-containing protein n=1 Tax=Lysinibacillus sp. NPDC056220 TaxID=3398580 RepID=UPI003BF61913